MIRPTVEAVGFWVCCLSLLTIGCTNNVSNTSSPNFSIQANQQDSRTPEFELATVVASDANTKLRQQIAQIAATAQGRVGVTATVLETGESVTWNGDQRFPMQSVYKFPIGMAVLAQVDQGKLSLDQRVPVAVSDFVSDLQHSPVRDRYPQGVELSLAQLLEYTVSQSDGTTCDVLLQLVGGPEVVTQYLRDLGVTDLVVANLEKEIGRDQAVQYRNYATPDAAVRLLRALHGGQGLSASSQTLLLRLMTETPTGLKRIKGLLPTGTVVAHKTGTSRTVDGVTAATNDVGLVTLPNGQHLAIAVFVSDSTANATVREAVIAKVTRAAWDVWSK